MTEKEIKEYKKFMEDIGNEYNCDSCPRNEGDFPNADLPCGQQNCWVTCHCRGGEE